MKILKVRFQNLNSLKGLHEIDLCEGPLADSGIFAITGPTGAGKSTILDAVTLALYGRAARYENEPNPQGMMSRHTGECSAEVVFEVAAGQFRAAWHLNRARKKPTGKIQPPKRFLYDAEDQPIAESVRDVDRKVEELVGLNVDRFLRSVLLAQNEFAKFLRSSVKERSLLLEQLTGTEIYSRLGELAHEMLADKEKRLAVTQAEINQISLLGKTELEDIAKERKRSESRLKEIATQLKKVGEGIDRGTRLKDLHDKKQRLESTREKLQKEKAAFAGSQKRLELHSQAVRFEGDVRVWQVAESTLKEAQSSFGKSRQEEAAAGIRLGHALDALETLAKKQLDSLKDSLAELATQRKENANELAGHEEWLKQNAADAGLGSARGDIGEAITTLATLRASLRDTTGKRKQKVEEHQNSQSALDTATQAWKAAVDEHSQQEKLLNSLREKFAELSGGQSAKQIQETVDAALQRLQSLDELSQRHDVLEDKLREGEKRNSEQKSREAACKESLNKTEAAESKWQQHIDLVRTLTVGLHRGELIASLEERRKELNEGEECPLCGSLEHPFVSSNNVTDSSLQAERVRIEREQTQERKLEKLYKDAAGEHGKLETQSREFVAQSTLLSEQAEKLKVEVAREAKRLKVSIADRNAIQDAVGSQRETVEDWKQRLGKVATADEAVDEAKIKSTESAGRVEKCEAERKAAADNAKRLEKEIADLDRQIQRAEESVVAATATVGGLLETFLPKGERIPNVGEESSLRKQLESRADLYTKYIDEKRNLIKDRDQFDDREKELNRAAEGVTKLANDCWSHHEDLKDWSTLEHADREQLVAKSELKCSVWGNVDEANDQVETLRDRRRDAIVKASALRDTVAGAQSKCRESLGIVESRIAQSIFESPASVIAALISEEDLGSLKRQQSELERRTNENRGELKSIEAGLQELKKQPLVDAKKLASFQAKLEELSEEQTQLTAVVTELELRIRDDDTNREKWAARTAGMQSELQSLESWRKLRSLIGSGDGKKFRVFAQGLSLDVLVQLANRHLARLTNRYRLERRAGEQLELEICDQHQAGTLRAMKSLSGGESFVASLALALGLSDLAGRNVRIDSLFIDEGFGSLDPDTLDVAVAALEELQASDKTIGVISHVELLKERITTQIRVAPKGGGVSELEIVG